MVNQSTMLLMAVIGTLILVLALLILFHENRNATKGYRLRKLEADRTASQLEQEILNMQIAQAQSLETLRGSQQVAGMVDVKTAQYVEMAPSLASTPSSAQAQGSVRE